MAVSCYQCIGTLTSDCHNGVTSSMVPLSCELLLAERENATSRDTSEETSTDEASTVSKCVTFVVTCKIFAVADA